MRITIPPQTARHNREIPDGFFQPANVLQLVTASPAADRLLPLNSVRHEFTPAESTKRDFD
jgi:hypothetical protein